MQHNIYATPRGISTRDLRAFQQALEDAVRAMRRIDCAVPPEPPAKPTVDPKAAARLRFAGWRDASHFAHHLARLGFKAIGAGMYSFVCGRPGSDKVIKVGSKMDGWVEYIIWAGRNGYLGTFAPKVHSLHILKTQGGSEFYVAVMERLHITVSRARRVDDTGHQAALAEHDGLIMNGRQLRSTLSVAREAPRWAQFVDDFRHAFRGAHLDMHDENWMLRFDGSLVLTDPIACDDRLSPWRRDHKTPARVRSTDWAKLCPQAPQPAFKHAQEMM